MMLLEFISHQRIEILPAANVERLAAVVHADGVPQISVFTATEIVELEFKQAQQALVALEIIRTSMIAEQSASVDCENIFVRGKP